MILKRLSAAGPMPLNSAAASIMPLVPFSYVARQGKGSALVAAKIKLRSLQAGGWVQIAAGVVTVQRTERQTSGLRQCVDELNTTGRCDTSAIWGNKRSAQNMIARMKRLGWVSPNDVWPVVSFVGRQPASIDEFNQHKQAARASK
jgi:hypothetical protein